VSEGSIAGEDTASVTGSGVDSCTVEQAAINNMTKMNTHGTRFMKQ
jgi:hypothetical protein